MATEHVRNAFKAKLAGLGIAGMTYVETSNAPTDPSTLPAEWMTLEFVPSDERQITFGAPGANIYRESGSGQVRLMVRPGETESPLLTYAQAVCDGFRQQVFDKVVVNEVSPPASGPGFNEGAWREAFVSIDYEYDRYI